MKTEHKETYLKRDEVKEHQDGGDKKCKEALGAENLLEE
jgi:hypothetical protein